MKFITILGILLLTCCVYSDPIDDFFEDVERKISLEHSKPKKKSPLKINKVLSPEIGNKIYPVGFTLQHFSFSFSGNSSLENLGNDLGFMGAYNFEGRDIPFLKEVIKNFEGLNSEFSIGLHYQDNVELFSGIDLRFRTPIEQIVLGSKLYASYSENFQSAQGLVYLGYKLKSGLVLKDDYSVLYVAMSSGKLDLNNFNVVELKKKAEKLSFQDNSVFGIYYNPDVVRKKYAFGLEYSNNYIMITLHLGF